MTFIGMNEVKNDGNFKKSNNHVNMWRNLKGVARDKKKV